MMREPDQILDEISRNDVFLQVESCRVENVDKGKSYAGVGCRCGLHLLFCENVTEPNIYGTKFFI